MIVLTIILILLVLLFAGSIESNLREAFSGDWMQFDEDQNPSERERLELENEEFDWGHNVKHRTEGDYE